MTVKVSGVCLRTISEQRSSGDFYCIDPSGVRFDKLTPVLSGFDYNIITYANVSFIDGRLYADFEIDNKSIMNGYKHLAVGVNYHGSFTFTKRRDFVIAESYLSCISAVIENSDYTMPNFIMTDWDEWDRQIEEDSNNPDSALIKMAARALMEM